MYNYIAQGEAISHKVVELVADSRTDVANLPTFCEAGSTCIVIEDSSVWMLDTNKIWKEL